MEEPVQFVCGQHRLYGMLHLPDLNKQTNSVVLIITGGPQIRSGAHRLYVQLSRFLLENGWASLRFDFEGAGDSEGEFAGFRNADKSISAAVDFLQQRINRQINIFIWSLCDGATASIMYGAMHPNQICGLVLCNPLTVSQQGMARSTIIHYYGKRFFNKEFLGKLIRFKLDIRETIKDLWRTLVNATSLSHILSNQDGMIDNSLPYRVLQGLHVLQQPVHIFLSGNDMVASNFRDEWKKKRRHVNDFKAENIFLHNIPLADHTFTIPEAKNDLFSLTLLTLKEIDRSCQHQNPDSTL